MESGRDEMRQRERMMRFAEMKLLGRITLRYTEHKGSLVLHMGFRDFAEIPEGPEYLQEYCLLILMWIAQYLLGASLTILKWNLKWNCNQERLLCNRSSTILKMSNGK